MFVAEGCRGVAQGLVIWGISPQALPEEIRLRCVEEGQGPGVKIFQGHDRVILHDKGVGRPREAYGFELPVLAGRWPAGVVRRASSPTSDTPKTCWLSLVALDMPSSKEDKGE